MPRPAINLLSLVIAVLFCIGLATSCKKGDGSSLLNSTTGTGTKPIAAIKLTGTVVAGAGKKLTLSVSALGTASVQKDVTLSTISAGLDMDASGLLPASMIGSSGFIFTGDSVIYNGITITNKTGIVTHGDMLNATKLYGNLAYATVAFGDGSGPQITTKRIPFFLYYKAVDQSGNPVPAHGADLFGIAHGYSNGNKLIASPLTYLPVSGDLISGFKLSMVNFNISQGACILTIGLTPADLEASNGFNLHPLSVLAGGAGYANYINGTIVYNGTSLSGPVAFSTGYTSASVIQDPKYTGTGYSALATGSTVRIVTSNGFNYIYTISNSAYTTVIENPASSGENRSIFGIDFFTQNEFLVDYTNHQIGLKNL
ncbi:hypothetical protein BEL04_13020 [Mucilaginibacter sp. PPCGB 2223]|nr:hypothetical protein BEL04_13020 [Mucilaginibacter sp. PPCGB 2223]